MSIAGAMLVVAAGAGWLFSEFSTVGHSNPLTPESGWWDRTMFWVGSNRIYVQGAVAGLLVLGSLLYLWRLLNKPKIVDFMIATEAEMKKVNWPSTHETFGYTWLVISGTFLIALILFVVDFAFLHLFQWLGVIKVSSDAAGS